MVTADGHSATKLASLRRLAGKGQRPVLFYAYFYSWSTPTGSAYNASGGSERPRETGNGVVSLANCLDIARINRPGNRDDLLILGKRSVSLSASIDASIDAWMTTLYETRTRVMHVLPPVCEIQSVQPLPHEMRSVLCLPRLTFVELVSRASFFFNAVHASFIVGD